MSSSLPFVLIDSLDPRARSAWSWGHEATSREVGTSREIATALERALDARAPVIVAQGSLAFLARVLTTHHRLFAGHAEPARIFSFSYERNLVDDLLELDESAKKRARRVLKIAAKQKYDEVTMSTLRVVASHAPHASLAFDVGLGALFELHVARQRGQLASALEIGRFASRLAEEVLGDGVTAGPARTMRVMIDQEPLTNSPAFVLASALPESFFELSMSREGGARAMWGEELSGLARKLARARAPLARLRGEGAQFRRITVDFAERYVLDGELITPGVPFVLRVEAGPPVSLLR